jgi:hypothetical protein
LRGELDKIGRQNEELRRQNDDLSKVKLDNEGNIKAIDALRYEN